MFSRTPNSRSRAFVEALEDRSLMSASEIGVEPPPPPPTHGSTVAQVVVISPRESETGRPFITVTVNPPPEPSIPDKAPPPPPTKSEIVITKLVDKASP